MNGRFIFDELTGMPTILATERAKRVDQTGAVNGESEKKSEKETEVGKDGTGEVKTSIDYFAKGNEHLTPPTTYQDSDDWNVRVFPNKYPLLQDHEIIVHSPDVNKDIAELPLEQTVRIIRAFLNRVGYFGSQDKEVIIFNNRGGKAGASIVHPHSQVVAARGFPGIVEVEKESALHYFNENNSCYWCDEYKSVLDKRDRLIHESKHFVLFVPKACRWSYEMKLVPKAHKPNFGFIDELEVNDLATVLKAALCSYDKLFEKPDRNFWVHTMRYEPYHWHMGFIPHIKVFGALELGADIWVSDRATPEDAARKLGDKVSECIESKEGEVSSIVS